LQQIEIKQKFRNFWISRNSRACTIEGGRGGEGEREHEGKRESRPVTDM